MQGDEGAGWVEDVQAGAKSEEEEAEEAEEAEEGRDTEESGFPSWSRVSVSDRDELRPASSC